MAISGSGRKWVAERARYCCEYCLCQEAYSPVAFSVDHIIPVSKGGSDELENLAFSCQGCNSFKYNYVSDYDRISGEEISLFNPRKQQWRDHFAWDSTYSNIVGLTAVGRVTVDRLKLNRTGVVNLRRALHDLKKHPPG